MSMKMVIAIINDEDAFQIVDKLKEQNFQVTKMASTGGFLRAGNTTLMCGVDEVKTQEVIDVINKYCKKRNHVTSITNGTAFTEGFVQTPMEVTVGGATVFVIDVEQFIKI